MLTYTRMAKNKDINAIMQIIKEAKKFLKDSGSSQWQGVYPDLTTIQTDIDKQNGLVLVTDGKISGYAAVVTGIEPTYAEIEGKWKNNVDPYATIHRMAMSEKYRGMHLADKFISNIISLKYAEGVKNFRIDTSCKNEIVQHIATSHNFEYRGIIYVTEDPEDKSRLAYELNL